MSEPQNVTFQQQSAKAAAIRNLGGMTWLYEKHVSRFRTEYADSAIRIRHMLASGKTAEACILAHSIKGLAGTLGFCELYHTAALLESSIKDTSEAPDDLLLFFEHQLEQI